MIFVKHIGAGLIRFNLSTQLCDDQRWSSMSHKGLHVGTLVTVQKTYARPLLDSDSPLPYTSPPLSASNTHVLLPLQPSILPLDSSLVPAKGDLTPLPALDLEERTGGYGWARRLAV